MNAAFLLISTAFCGADAAPAPAPVAAPAHGAVVSGHYGDGCGCNDCCAPCCDCCKPRQFKVITIRIPRLISCGTCCDNGCGCCGSCCTTCFKPDCCISFRIPQLFSCNKCCECCAPCCDCAPACGCGH